LKLAVATLIRNEIDIVGSFLQHLDALFDHVQRSCAASMSRTSGTAN
jgi:hypothetical protein